MNKYTLNFALLLGIILIFIYITLNFGNLDLINIPFLLLSFISIGLSGKRYSFVYLVSATLALGFGFLFYALYNQSSLEQQFLFIFNHLLVCATILMFWFIDKQYKSTFIENKDLKLKVVELEGYKNIPSILSYTQFLSHVSYILASSKRRGEKNYLLKISVHEHINNISSVEHILIDSVIKNFRESFDLITQNDKNQVLVFIQNTTEEGANIAIGRLRDTLHTRIELKLLPFNFYLYEIEKNIEDTLKDSKSLIKEDFELEGIYNKL